MKYCYREINCLPRRIGNGRQIAFQLELLYYTSLVGSWVRRYLQEGDAVRQISLQYLSYTDCLGTRCHRVY